MQKTWVEVNKSLALVSDIELGPATFDNVKYYWNWEIGNEEDFTLPEKLQNVWLFRDEQISYSEWKKKVLIRHGGGAGQDNNSNN